MIRSIETILTPVRAPQHRQLRWVTLLSTTAVFLLASVVLYRQFHVYTLDAIVGAFSHLELSQVLPALALTGLSYLIFTLYDVLAASYVGLRASYRRIAPASLTSYAVCNTVGLSLLLGGPIRYKFYSRLGSSLGQAVGAVAFCVFTSWTGLVTLSGLVLIMEPALLSRALAIPIFIARTIGVCLLVISASYLISSFLRQTPYRLFYRHVQVLGSYRTLAQMSVSVLNWTVVAAVVHLLMPPELGLSRFAIVGLFVTAQTVGCLSQVPAGVGVLEATYLVLIERLCGSEILPQVLSSLIAYRAIYCLLPLALMASLHVPRIIRNQGVERLVFKRPTPARCISPRIKPEAK